MDKKLSRALRGARERTGTTDFAHLSVQQVKLASPRGGDSGRAPLSSVAALQEALQRQMRTDQDAMDSPDKRASPTMPSVESRSMLDCLAEVAPLTYQELLWRADADADT